VAAASHLFGVHKTFSDGIC